MPEILIVDDSISVRRALEITLRNHAMQSRSTVSGEDALALLGDGEYRCDVMLVDVIMPGMSGIEVCRAVKADETLADLPVILMSGNVDDEVRAQAREAGANGVLRKPFRSEELIPMVEDLISRHEAQHATHDDVTGPAHDDRIDGEHLDALNETLQRYEDHPRVRDAVILDREGHPIRQTGTVLPENIQMFARFFTNTAGVLGKQMLGEDIQDVTIRYGAHEMVIHNLPGHFMVVLMSEEQRTLKA